MPAIHVAPLYVAIIAILMAVLSTLTGAMRARAEVALGDGGNTRLALAIRRFGNLSEYAAMALLVLAMMEVQGIAERWLHLYGGLLVALRLLHPLVLFDDMGAPAWKKAGRFVSAAGTALLMLIGAIALIVTLAR